MRFKGGSGGGQIPKIRKSAVLKAGEQVKYMGRRAGRGVSSSGRRIKENAGVSSQEDRRALSERAADELEKKQKRLLRYAERKAERKALDAAERGAAKGLRVSIRIVRAALKGVAALFKGLLALLGPAGGLAIVLLAVILALLAALDPFPVKKEEGHAAVMEVNRRAQERFLSVTDKEVYDTLKINGQRADWLHMLAAYSTYYDYWDEYQGRLLEATGLLREPEDISDILDDVYRDWHASSLLSAERLEQEKEFGFSFDLNELDEGQRELAVRVSPFTLEGYEAWIWSEGAKARFKEYLSEDYRDALRELLYGTDKPSIVDVAEAEFGSVGGERYWKDYYGQPSRWEWCAIFVSYCVHHSYLDELVKENCGSVMEWWDYFVRNGRYIPISEGDNPLPEPGWIIFYNWWEDEEGKPSRDGKLDHIAIVTEVRTDPEGAQIVTIEGNVRDSCLMLVKDWKKLYEIGVTGYGYFDLPEPEEP